MIKKEIEKKVREALAVRLNADLKKIKLDSFLVEDLKMDSFGAVEVIFELKDRFGIEIPEEDFRRIKKVEDIVRYISSYIT